MPGPDEPRAFPPVNVEVALPLPVEGSFTYAVPESLRSRAVPGARVVVPFRNRQHIGWIVEQTPAGATMPKRVRAVVAIPDEHPTLTPNILRLCRWMTDYYLAPLGLSIRSAQPRVLTDVSTEVVRSVEVSTGDAGSPDEPGARLLQLLREMGGEASFGRLRRALGAGRWRPVVERLIEAGLITRSFTPPRVDPVVRTRRVLTIARELPSLQQRDEIFGRAQRQRELYEYLEGSGGRAETADLASRWDFSYTVQRALVERGLARVLELEERRDPYGDIEPEDRLLPPLTPRQQEAIGIVEETRRSGAGAVLLHGVTGSGKTRVYIEILRKVVGEEGKGAIVLVPEIALTPQTVSRFRAEFGDAIAVLHSALSDGERYDEWRALRDGEKRIAVGARSAIFAPIRDLGAIIIDEEHESSYKQSEAPRYHARDVALMRGRLEEAVCVLGSATPALESWHNVAEGKHRIATLPERVGGATLPTVTVAAKEWVGGTPLSDALRDALSARLARGEQSILLLNRRGYATMASCRACGHVWECPSCSVAMTLHRRLGRLVCHHCLQQAAAPRSCPICSQTEIGYTGLGTEQLERLVGETFPSAVVARMDVDTTTGKWAHHEILDRVGKGEVDILLGTQMIAKGLDLPNVTLVGVVNADTGIHMPDFRASERTFQLLTQVAGRAGRAERAGEVIVQTSMADHFAIRHSLQHDYLGFAEKELEERRSIGYPPFGRLANVVFSDPREQRVERAALACGAWLEGLGERMRADGVRVLGPAPCPIARLRDRWRWHVLLLAERAPELTQWLYRADRWGGSPAAEGVRVTIDRDPVSVM